MFVYIKYCADFEQIYQGKDFNKFVINSDFFKNRQYRYATTWDIILIIIGCVFTIVKSMSMPAMFIVFGEFTTLMVDRSLGNSTTSTSYLMHIFGGGKVL